MEHFCEMITNLDQWFRRRCRLKTICFSSGGHFVQRRGTVCLILVEDIMGNIHVKLF